MIGKDLMWLPLQLAHHKVSQRRSGDFSLDVIPELAAIHVMHSMSASVQANINGQHSVAIGLLRMCVEALTVVEIGLQEVGYRDRLLRNWEEDKGQGALRKTLERDVWPRYGKGLWNESWGDFFGQFAQAVQPYAHYTKLLQGWQFATEPGTPLVRKDRDGYVFMAKVGVKTYDGLKATRITLLHTLLGWTTARIIAANGGDSDLDSARFDELGKALAKSNLFGGGHLTWHQEFFPMMFDVPSDLARKAE
jgi:hypothetical protein